MMGTIIEVCQISPVLSEHQTLLYKVYNYICKSGGVANFYKVGLTLFASHCLHLSFRNVQSLAFPNISFNIKLQWLDMDAFNIIRIIIICISIITK